MKRSEALAPLSRDHHTALYVALELSRATATNAATAAAGFVTFLADHELAHFKLEESLLLPALSESEQDRSTASRVLAEHEYFRDAMQHLRDDDASPEVPFLHQVGDRLRAHVRMEENELFPYLESSLDRTALDQIGARLAARAD